MSPIALLQALALERTRKLERRGAALGKIVTKIFAGEDFLPWTWLNTFVDVPAPGGAGPGGVNYERVGEKWVVGEVGDAAIEEVLAKVARLQPDGAVGGGKVFTAWDGNGAQPGLVGGATVIAGSRERVSGGVGSVARDLLQ